MTSRPGRVPAGVDDAAVAVAALEPELELPLVRIERAAPVHELADPVRPLGDDELDGRALAEALPDRQRVVTVGRQGVVVR